jgi:hypothetical protein
MRRVVIESPFAALTPAGVARNTRYVRACMRDSLLRGESPYASHALYTLPGVLRDEIPEDRERGMEAGWAWIAVADGNASYTDLGISDGMRRGIDLAKSQGRTIETRQLGPDWDTLMADAPSHSMVIEPEAQELFRDLETADAVDAADAVRLGVGSPANNRRAALRRALFEAYEKGRQSK